MDLQCFVIENSGYTKDDIKGMGIVEFYYIVRRIELKLNRK